ncbi:nucleotidyl transferase AbiEii/AbiGii toxin family protein [Bradyrhizobium sp. WSM1743]|uniref:nucleotidyl transferase AbiEii/AbiGii toxin family protein n=1 Tax=Bradyrhizobium sp. WSM1743 TaxID=318996 RepID=UPI0009FDE674
MGENLVFKGGTSLSKADGAVRRFPDDVDLTYGVRAIAPDLAKHSEDNPSEPQSKQKNGTPRHENASRFA